MRPRLHLAVALLVLGCFSTTKGATVGDSIADFSGVQGHLDWQYGYAIDPTLNGYTASSFQLMTVFDALHPDTYGSSVNGVWSVSPDFAPVWTALTPSGGHGNGAITSGDRQPVEQWAIRRWVSDVQGIVTVSGQYADTYIGGNGSHARVFVDGVPVWDQRILDGTAPTSFQFSIPMTVGSAVDFALDPEASDDRSDTALFSLSLQAPLTPGDTNFDGAVNFDDLLALAKNYGRTTPEAHWFDGDFDNNGKVDFGDLLGLARNYGRSSDLDADLLPATAGDTFAANAALAQSLVPEPAACLGIVTIAAIARRRSISACSLP